MSLATVMRVFHRVRWEGVALRLRQVVASLSIMAMVCVGLLSWTAITPGAAPMAGATGGHCGPVGAPGRPNYDYLPGGTFVGDICAWHDKCNELNDKNHYNYDCNPLFGQALHKRCETKWGNSQPGRSNCDYWANEYLGIVVVNGAPSAGGKHGGPPPQDVGYPPGL